MNPLNPSPEITQLVVYDDDSSDALFITTEERLEFHKGEIASVAIGFDEPFESEQRRYVHELVDRYNSHAALIAERDELVRVLRIAREWVSHPMIMDVVDSALKSCAGKEGGV